MGFRGFLAIGVVGLLTAVSAQQPAEQPQLPPPTIRSGTNVVRVDATVVDGSGKPVTSLTADDFEIKEDGEPQAITSFKLLEVNGQPTDELSLPIRSRSHAAAEAARDDVRVFLIFWDEYHIDPFVSTLRAQDQLRGFLLEAFGPTDLVAFMDPLTPLDAIEFTRDRRALADHLHQLKGRRGIYVPPRSVLEETQLARSRDIERVRAQVTVAALKGAMLHLGSIREGRKAIIYIGESLGPLGTDLTKVMSDLLRTGSDTNTAVYTVDPRGLQAGRGISMRMSDVLPALAYGTGAEPITSNDFGGALRRVVSHASVVYLLGYAPKQMAYDGRFHQIKVRVKRPGMDVRARAGYWAPRVADMQRAATEAAAYTRPPEVARAFNELPPANSPKYADLFIGVAPATEGRSAVTLAWAPRAAAPTGPPLVASVTAEASNGTGQVFSGPVESAGAAFEAPPGPLNVTFAIRDADGNVLDRELRTVTIPQGAKTALAFGTPIVFRAQNANETRALQRNARPPYAGRDFERTDRLRIRVSTYGEASGMAAVTARLLGTRGASLAPLPVRPGAGPRLHEIDLPLMTLAKGEFVVAIEARHGEQRVETLVPFRVVR